MVANFLEYFYTDKYDTKIVLTNQNKSYTVLDLKTLIKNKIQNAQNISINFAKCSMFEFVVEFLARVFTQKEIYIYNENSPLVQNPKFEFHQINPNEIIIYFSTSGSSGSPKIIEKSLANLFKESQDLLTQFPELKSLEFASTTTMNHLFGFTFHFMLPLNCEGVINLNQISIPEDINKDGICLISTPSFLEILAKYNYKPQKTPRYIISAGSALKTDIFKYAKSISSKTIEIYGSTETGIMAFRTDENSKLKLFDNVTITSNTDSIEVQTPYSKKSVVSIQDNIVSYPNKFIEILGRNDRIYKIQEKRISAENIETLIKNIPYITDAYTIKLDNKLACLCVLSKVGLEYLFQNGIIELVKSIKSFLKKNTEIIPQKWKFLDEIPHTQNGKVDEKEILEIFNLNLSIPVPIKKQVEKNFATISLYFYKNCNFFKGHFDRYHIVPGVIQLFLAQYYSSKVFKITNIAGQYRKIKFKNVIRPNQIIDLVLEKTTKGIMYTYKDEEKTYSSGVLPIVKLERTD